MRSGLNTASQPPVGYENLFQIDATSGVFSFVENPKGYYGTWLVTIEAYDHGHLWDSQIQLNSTETYEVTVEPYNFNAPRVVSPAESRTFRLRYALRREGLT